MRLITNDAKKYSELDFVCWNARGLACKSNNKINEKDFKKMTKNADIIFVCETWSEPEQVIALQGYDITLCHRPKSKNATHASAGIAAIVKSELSSLVEVYKTVGDLYMWLQIKCIDHQLFVSFLYIPPGKLESDTSEDTVFDQLLRDQANTAQTWLS